MNLKTWRDGHVLHAALARPEVRNAFDEEAVGELTAFLKGVKKAESSRVVCLSGEGPAFCAGGDLNWMRRAAGWSKAGNRRDALRLFRMLLAVRECPRPVVARVHGAALGGGSGLVAACDRAIAAEDAVFGFTEVRLGIIPGAISPFVVEKIGAGQARELFTSGRRFGAAEALRIGLVHQVVPPGWLDDAVAEALKDYAACPPEAMAQAKRLAGDVAAGLHSFKALGPRVAARIAAKRADPEGREGIAAFLEKRAPGWAKP